MTNRLLLINLASISLFLGALSGTSQWIIIICHLGITLFLIAMSPIASIILESDLKAEPYMFFLAYIILLTTLGQYYTSKLLAFVSFLIITGYFSYCLLKVNKIKVGIQEDELIEKSFFQLLLEKKEELLLAPSLLIWLTLNIVLSLLY
ncbi:MAG TPA: hypothetical protein PKC76_08630 [Saprospiraceae bacterium]|nr:hypothetical protein [Saprospiraceae bacterium]HMP24183.1 hypothetical protein [Saprospiraceae bacterium]